MAVILTANYIQHKAKFGYKKDKGKTVISKDNLPWL